MEKLSYEKYFDRVYGAFLGKTVVGTLGAPFEGIKMPLELPFKREMIDCMLPNDDLDLQVLWLDVVENCGPDFTPYDIQKRFTEYCSYNPGEYAVMRKNFNRGIYSPTSGKFCNDFYINGMGCPIRSEIWAALAPGDPAKAAAYSTKDGVADHAGDSVYAEQFLAALEAASFYESDLHKLFKIGLEYVPDGTRIKELITYTLELCDKYDNVKTILRKILFRYGHPDCTNLYQNIGITLAALLKGNLDIIKTGMDALNCGYDTDCTCATAGAIIGFIRGAKDLIEEYSLTDVKYVLGVKSNRRSDSVKDLAEDICLLGAYIEKDRIEGAPKKEFNFTPSQYPIRFTTSYENDDPTFYPGKPCCFKLTIDNLSDKEVSSKFLLEGLNLKTAFDLSLKPGETVIKEFTVEFPEDEKVVYDRNIYTISYKDGNDEKFFRFGICGAMPWKAIGPIWRTDPICDTESLIKADLQYSNILNQVPYEFHRVDILRRFHLNCCPDTDTAFLSPDDCFEPFSEDKDTKYEETVFWQKEDSFTMDDITGFSGPSVVYLARELVCPDDRTVFAQLGHSSPFAFWVNGELIAERKNCDTWDAENVHLADIKLKKGVNRIVLRLTRVNKDAKYNLVFGKKITMGELFVDFGAIRPEFFSENK